MVLLTSQFRDPCNQNSIWNVAFVLDSTRAVEPNSVINYCLAFKHKQNIFK